MRTSSPVLPIAIALSISACLDDSIDELGRAAAPLAAFNEYAYEPELRTPFETGGFNVGVKCQSGDCQTVQHVARTDIATPAAENFETNNRGRNSTLQVLQFIDEEIAWRNTSRVIEEADRRMVEDHPGEFMMVKVWLWEDDFDFALLRNAKADSAAYNQLVDDRRRSVSRNQEPVVQLVEELGGFVVRQAWLTNSLFVAVPAQSVRTLLEHADVYGGYLGSTHQSDDTGDGAERRSGFQVTVPENGLTAGGGRVAVGIIESDNPLNTAHVGWLDTAAGGSRILDTDDCGTFDCSGSATTSSVTHGTQVAAILSGGIMQGQDPAIPAGVARLRRSGLANEALIRYYGASDLFTEDMSNAIDTAVSDNVDVINLSAGMFVTCSDLCNINFNPSNINADIFAAENAGVVFIKSAGNENQTCGGTCNTSFPAYHPDVISVSGLADTTGTSHTQVGLLNSAGRGFRWVLGLDGLFKPIPTVGLTAFGVVSLTFGSGSATYLPSLVTISGTSFAAPQVSSLAVGFRQAMTDLGLGAFGTNAWAIQINLLLMGDGRCGPNCELADSIDANFGYGFPKYFTPTAAQIGDDGAWGTRSEHIVQGQTIAWTVGDAGPEGNTINGWKWALALDSGLTQIPNLHVRVVDTCHPSGVFPVRTAVVHGTRYRIIIRDPAEIRGKCLEMRVTGIAVKPGGETFWSADYFFSNNPVQHVFDN